MRRYILIGVLLASCVIAVMLLRQCDRRPIMEVNKQIITAKDDWDQPETGNNNDGANQVEIRSHTIAALRGWGGFRFIEVNIPAGATILSANLQLYGGPSGVYDDINVDVYAEQSVSAANSDGDNLTARTLTTASVAWVEDDLGVDEWQTKDIAAIIQELVDDYGDLSDASICIVLKPRTDDYKEFWAECYNYEPTEAAKLVITWRDGFDRREAILDVENTDESAVLTAMGEKFLGDEGAELQMVSYEHSAADIHIPLTDFWPGDLITFYDDKLGIGPLQPKVESITCRIGGDGVERYEVQLGGVKRPALAEDAAFRAAGKRKTLYVKQ